MKKYIVIILLACVLFNGCVRQEDSTVNIDSNSTDEIQPDPTEYIELTPDIEAQEDLKNNTQGISKEKAVEIAESLNFHNQSSVHYSDIMYTDGAKTYNLFVNGTFKSYDIYDVDGELCSYDNYLEKQPQTDKVSFDKAKELAYEYVQKAYGDLAILQERFDKVKTDFYEHEQDWYLLTGLLYDEKRDITRELEVKVDCYGVLRHISAKYDFVDGATDKLKENILQYSKTGNSYIRYAKQEKVLDSLQLTYALDDSDVYVTLRAFDNFPMEYYCRIPANWNEQYELSEQESEQIVLDFLKEYCGDIERFEVNNFQIDGLRGFVGGGFRKDGFPYNFRFYLLNDKTIAEMDMVSIVTIETVEFLPIETLREIAVDYIDRSIDVNIENLKFIKSYRDEDSALDNLKVLIYEYHEPSVSSYLEIEVGINEITGEEAVLDYKKIELEKLEEEPFVPKPVVNNNTPEEVITDFISRIQETKYDEALSFYPYDIISQSYDYHKHNLHVYGKDEKTYSEQEKKESHQKRYDNFIMQTQVLFSGFIDDYIINSLEELEDILRKGAISDFKEIKIIGIDEIKAWVELEDNEEHLKNITTYSEIYGSDSLTERIALIEYKNKLYMLGFRLLNYDGYWYLLSLNSTYATLHSIGIQEVTLEEYQEFVFLR